ncbi:MAG: hypothetical protein AAGG72_07510 [Pseudomonadota bacterium]
MAEVVFYLVAAIAVTAGVVLGAVMIRGFIPQPSASGAKLFGQKSIKRLEVVDTANLDGRRKLILLRRDDKEHLIMTGGPVDVVIETGISHDADRMRSADRPQSADRLRSANRGQSKGVDTTASMSSPATAADERAQ